MGVVAFQRTFEVLVGFRADTEPHGSVVSEREVTLLRSWHEAGTCRLWCGLAGRSRRTRGSFPSRRVLSQRHAVWCFARGRRRRPRADFVPNHALLGETDSFVVRPPRFERSVFQNTLVVTPDVQLKIQRLHESLSVGYSLQSGIAVRFA